MYGQNEALNAWMAQLSVYHAIKANPSLGSCSATIQSFGTTAAGSRYDWLTQIEDHLSAADYAGAQGLLGAPPIPMDSISGPNGVLILDGHGGDNVVNNYTSFYQLYIRYHIGTLTAPDSAQVTVLANKCPLIDGAVVYQARALYRLLTNDLTVFNDDYCELRNGNDGSHARKSKPVSAFPQAQSYMLSPNPNIGDMTLMQLIADDRPAEVAVRTAVGATFYKATIAFKGGSAHFDLRAMVPGLYLLELRDGDGLDYTLKFVVQ